MEPGNAVSHHNRACCLKNMGRYEEAVADFLKSLELDSTNPLTYANIALVYRRLEKYETAIEYFTK